MNLSRKDDKRSFLLQLVSVESRSIVNRCIGKHFVDRPLSRCRHFGFETRLDGYKQYIMYSKDHVRIVNALPTWFRIKNGGFIIRVCTGNCVHYVRYMYMCLLGSQGEKIQAVK